MSLFLMHVKYKIHCSDQDAAAAKSLQSCLPILLLMPTDKSLLIHIKWHHSKNFSFNYYITLFLFPFKDRKLKHDYESDLQRIMQPHRHNLPEFHSQPPRDLTLVMKLKGILGNNDFSASLPPPPPPSQIIFPGSLKSPNTLSPRLILT